MTTLVRCGKCDIGWPPEEIDAHVARCPMRPEPRVSLSLHTREVTKMGLQKFGTGEVLPDPEDSQKTAKANWTEKDDKALAEENATADEE